MPPDPLIDELDEPAAPAIRRPAPVTRATPPAEIPDEALSAPQRHLDAYAAVDKAATDQFSQRHPFLPTGWQPPTAPRVYDRAAKQADVAARQQNEAERADRTSQIKQYNSRVEQQMRGSGQRFYKDDYGVFQPIIEAGTNKPLYTPSAKKEKGFHPETHAPSWMSLNRYGETEYHQPNIVASPDLTDDQLYYDFGDQGEEPAGRAEDLMQHPDFKVARTAMRAVHGRRAAMWKEAIEPMEAAAAEAGNQYQLAQQRKMELQGEIEQLQQQAGTVGGDPLIKETTGGIMGIGAQPSDNALRLQSQQGALNARIQKLSEEQGAIDQQVTNGGPLARQKRMAEIELGVFKSKAKHDSYSDLADERRAILKAQGKPEANDPTLTSILQAQQTYGTAIGKFSNQMQSSAPAAAKTFDTALQPAEEQQFQQWKAKYAPQDSGADYDLRGAFKANVAPDQTGHWPDTFKKPNHPTFSDQSVYAKDAPDRAGHWDGETFIPAGGGDRLSGEPIELLRAGKKGVGGVSVQELARRYGAGTGPTNPGSLVAIKKRTTEIDQMLANDETKIAPEARVGLEEQKTYLDQLYAERRAKLSPDVQRKVDAVLGAQNTTTGGALGRSAFEAIGPGAGAFAGAKAGAAVGAMIPGANATGVSEAVGAGIGALAGGIMGAIAQKKAMHALAPETQRELEALQEVDAEQHPIAQVAGSLATNAAMFKIEPLMAAKGLAALAKIARGAITTQVEKNAAKALAVQTGYGAALGAAGPAIQGRAPTVADVTQSIAQMMVFGNARFEGGRGGAPAPESGTPNTPRTPEERMRATENMTPEEANAALGQELGAPDEAAQAVRQTEQARAEQGTVTSEIPSPTGEQPKSAEGSADVFERRPPQTEEPTAAKPAAESASVFEGTHPEVRAEQKSLSDKEAAAQRAVDELSEATGVARERILETRGDKDVDAWAKDLAEETAYQRDPINTEPDRRISELKSDLERLDAEWAHHKENRQRTTEVLRGKEAVRNDQTASRARTAARADDVETALAEAGRTRRGPAGREGLAGDLGEAASLRRPVEDLPPDLAARRRAIEEQLLEAERVRQSPEGLTRLNEDLRGRENPPDEPGPIPAEPKPTEPTPETDAARYKEIEAEMRTMIKDGKANDPAFMKLWGENEEIKNRNQGMPPGQVSGGTKNPEVAALAPRPKDAAPVGAHVVEHTPETVAGDKINKEWTAETAKGAAPKTAEAAPPATAKLSDRAIAALKSLKVDIDPTRLRSPTPDVLLAGARNTALDLAILAIRAGRKIDEVIRMAVARFKSKHPDATADDVSLLEADIREAHAIGSATQPSNKAPKTEKSLLPESLKESGVPAEFIEYQVRNQEERKKEAARIVRQGGREAAEAKLSDRSLPGDTRVAIGGQLINDRMLALKDAKPEHVEQITRDIRRITAKMQPELATQAGQQIAMFGALYKDARVAAGMEYVRSVENERTRQMGGDDATKAAGEAAEAFNKNVDKTARDKAIDKLKERYTTKPVRRMLDQLKRAEVTKELNRLGVLTREDMLHVAGNALGMPGVSKEKLKNLADIADRIENAKTHAEREKATLELADTLNIYKGVNPLDLESSILTLNIMSGYTTQLGNLAGNTLNSIAQLGTAAIANPSKVGALTKGFLNGIGLGIDQAHSILRTGRGSRDLQDKTNLAGSALQTVDYTRDFPKLNETAGNLLTTRARLADKVGRLMKAADAVFYYPAREAYARMSATKALEGGLTGDALKTAIDRTLHVTPEAFNSAKVQAAREGYEGVDRGRRVADIIEERRAQTPVGAEAVRQSEQFGAETTYNNEPVGIAGVIYRAASKLVQEAKVGGVPVLKPWLMFLRVPTNVFNATTNFTPIGAARAKFGMTGTKKGEWRNFNADERRRLYVQSVVGTALMGGLVHRILDKGDVDVTAKGPDDASRRRQLMNGGWRPYSIKVGDKYVSYRDSPLLVPLALVGHVADSIKYQKMAADATMESRVGDAIMHSPETIFQTSMLSSFADLMSSLSGKGDTTNVARTLGSIPANLAIPYSRLLQQIDQTMDPRTYDSKNPLTASIPFVRRQGEPVTDVEGREQTYAPMDRFAGTDKNDPVDTVLRDKNVFIPDVGRDVKIGNRTMTDAERDTYRKVSGQRIRVRLQAITPRLRGMTQEQVDREVRRISDEERTKAKAAVGRAGRN